MLLNRPGARYGLDPLYVAYLLNNWVIFSLLNVFLFRYQKIQLIILKLVGFILIFGLFNFFDERSISQSLKDLGHFYFIISFILVYLSHKAISKDKSIIDSSNRLR